MPWNRRDVALLLGALTCAACGNEPGGDGPNQQAQAEAECEGDYDAFEPGMSKLAEPGSLQLTLQAAEPSPPSVHDDNTWTLAVLDSEGSPVDGAELRVSPYMPKHQHGSAEVVIEGLGDGAYRLSAIELSMPGVWEIPISVTPPDGEPSEAAFRLCIAEQ
jgi:hypothetical protein